MFENLFVLGVMLVSGLYIVRRLQRISGAGKRAEPACKSCASASCAVEADTGEKGLRMHSPR
ncbi:MAG: hypothetical protein IGS03_16865 [Candidatus Sericytochromatia bacterium]|nr:hypothetical protein [Candidatus Sericytochromatia bacterium]